MAVEAQAPAISFDTHPSRYTHWRLSIDPPVATLTLDVQENEGLFEGYVLKLNSYDLGVDIELADAVERLRFEHPEVRAVVITSGNEKVFCAGANIGMLAQSTHAHKVNFCKFTNETRLAIEDASANSGQAYICALNGTASGGGYEIALACEHIVLVDDRSSAVSLPELPLLGVLPGTGGLTRLVDKRHVRRDIADVFSTRAEGVKGETTLKWGLVDELVPRSRFDDAIRERALALAEGSSRPNDAHGIELTPVEERFVRTEIDREQRTATITIAGPEGAVPATIDASFWSLAVARELDRAIVHLRFNEPEIGTFVLRSIGDPDRVLAFDDYLVANAENWLAREVVLLWKRVLKRLDVTSRSIITLVEPDSCFAGLLAELVIGADRSYILEDDRSSVTLGPLNFGPLPMGNGQTRLRTKLGDVQLEQRRYSALEAAEAGLVTLAVDDLDWDDEVRLAIEERASFSPDALTAMEQNLRFAGPETMETKIFGRLSCWQNWVFSRPNATGPEGALPRYGTGQRAVFDRKRV